MNTKPNFTNNSWKSLNWLLTALALALIVPARAGTQPAAIPFSDIGARATASYQGDALGVTATTDGARLRCGFQKLVGHATAEGLWLESTKPGGGKLRLVATAIGRAGLSTLNSQPSTILPSTGTVSVQDKLVRFTRPGLTEEYSVSVDEVRQDFVVESPPSTLNQSAGDLRVELALSGARAEAAAGGARLRLDGSGRSLAYSRLRAEDATGRELTARLEVVSADRLAVSVADADATYPLRIDPTFSDADWVSLNPGLPGANDVVRAVVVDGSGNVYAGGDFTIIGSVPANRIAKWNGTAWSALGSGTSGSVAALAVSGNDLYVGGYFTTAGGIAVNRTAKWNGSSWSTLGSGIDNSWGHVNTLAVIGTDVYAGGYFTTAGGVTVNYIAKWDGSAWLPLETPGEGVGLDGEVFALAVGNGGLYVGGGFSRAGGVPQSAGIARWDGGRWWPVGSGPWGQTSGVHFTVRALAVNGTDLYVGGAWNQTAPVENWVHCVAKWDGSTWSDLAYWRSGSYVESLAASGNALYAGGYFTTRAGVPVQYIARWSGGSWFGLGSGTGGGANSDAYALALSGTNLYVGGGFTAAGGLAANHIARWNGSAWAVLGSGMDGNVNALVVGGTNLYGGGEFTTANGGVTNCVAKWNGSAWSALGTGMSGSNPDVYALAMIGTNLYAGGLFTNAGGVAATNIARWNGAAWSALGSGMNDRVGALAVSGNELYAGGYFTTAGGSPAKYIAKWDGSAWSALGSGMDQPVGALAVCGNDLYVGGDFKSAGGVAATNIARWNGSAWSALGSGMNGRVGALAVIGNMLYAGGFFTTAGGAPANYIAKWDGSAWSALGSGVSGGYYPPYVSALAAGWSDLYVGGRFTNAGGVAANYIAKWDGNAWSALGLGMSGGFGTYPDVNVYALATDGVGHLFVGGAFYFAGTNLSPYVAQANIFPPGGAVRNVRVEGGAVILDFLGLPGAAYALQRATNVRFTQNLATLLTTNAPAPDGLCCYADTNPPGTTAFYRLLKQ